MGVFINYYWLRRITMKSLSFRDLLECIHGLHKFRCPLQPSSHCLPAAKLPLCFRGKREMRNSLFFAVSLI